MSRALATALLREQAADPWRCWIRYAPVRWPGPDRPWTDLAAGVLGSSDGEPEVLSALLGPRLEDVLYLPPVPAALVAARDRLAAQHAARGTPVIVQLLPGEARPNTTEEASGVVVVWDLLALALADRDAAPDALQWLDAGRAGDAAVLPLLAGSVAGEGLESLAARLAAAGVTALQPMQLELTGRDRRALGESMSEASYLRLFHGDEPGALPVARAAARHGLLPLLPRPLPRPPLRGAGNLRVAGALAACGELCLLLAEPESRAQALLRAARFAEREGRDLAALARDGHLPVLPWLEGEPLQVAAEAAGSSEPELWRQLLSRLQAA